MKNFSKKLNPFKQCKEYNVSMWKCPQFLFPVMGAVIIASIIATYVIARRFVEEEFVALIVLGITALLFVADYIIISSFERLAQASKSKSEFISVLSHRLREPLSSVKWGLTLVTDNMNKQQSVPKETIETIRTQNEKMINIVNDLLMFYNIENNKLVINPSPFSLSELVNEIIKRKIQAHGADVNISTTIPPSLRNVFADRQKIKAILNHLIDNAITYSKGQGKKIVVSLSQQSKFIQVMVSDEGIGIPKKEIERIFDKFFRGEGKPQFETEGTGIGLFISKVLVEKSGGKIGVDSVEGQGTDFWFTLPVSSKN